MKSLKGKSCLLEISYNGKRLFFHVSTILEVTNTHITFLDRHGEQFSFRLEDVIEANQVT